MPVSGNFLSRVEPVSDPGTLWEPCLDFPIILVALSLEFIDSWLQFLDDAAGVFLAIVPPIVLERVCSTCQSHVSLLGSIIFEDFVDQRLIVAVGIVPFYIG